MSDVLPSVSFRKFVRERLAKRRDGDSQRVLASIGSRRKRVREAWDEACATCYRMYARECEGKPRGEWPDWLQWLIDHGPQIVQLVISLLLLVL